MFNEPFDLRYKPRYSLVVDRVGWWYLLPREWLKKIALMDDVYLLNNPFTFQSMEKHSAYCAMMRLGLKVPDTWLIPHKQPPWNERFPTTAARYNRSFDLNEIGDYVGFPLYLKPFDGGQWRGVSRARDQEELRRGYDESGEQLMHVQSAVDDFEVFARSLSIGAETRVMWFDPDKPMYDRYQVKHDFLTPDQGFEVETISKVVNAFFRWEFNSCESIVREGEVFPIDYANASPDVAVTSLHYYFPWAMTALVRWCAFCLAEGGACASTSTRCRGSRSATGTTSRTRRSCASTGSSPTSTFRPTPTPSSAPARSRTSRRRRTSGSKATSSTGCSWPRCARRSPRMSTRGSPSTTVACWPRGPATCLGVRAGGLEGPGWKEPCRKPSCPPGPPPPGRTPLTKSVKRAVSVGVI